jgi:hypothetical protein
MMKSGLKAGQKFVIYWVIPLDSREHRHGINRSIHAMKNILVASKLSALAFALVTTLTLNKTTAASWVTWEVSAGGNGHSYLAVPGFEGLSCNIAYDLAQALGGYLATITSAAENDFVYGLVNNSSFFTSYNGSGPALGGYNAGTPSSPNWSWVTGEPWTYDNWGPGLPNYADFGSGPEDRLHYFSSVGSTPANTWNDIYQTDGNLGGYVVEVVPEPSPALLIVAALMVGGCRKWELSN